MLQVKSQAGQNIISKVRNITSSFPEVEEHIDKFGHLSFRIKDKPFVIIGESDNEIPSLSIKTLKTTQSILITQGDRFFKSPYIGQHGWTSLHTSVEWNWNEIADLIKEAFLQTAPKKVLKVLQG